MRNGEPNAPQSAPDRPQRLHEQGLALIAVLWFIASGTLLVAAFNVNVRSGLAFVRSEVQLSQTDSLLDAGLEIAATRLIDGEPARRWYPDGLWHTVAFSGSSLRIRIQDPNGLVDLNKADEKTLLAFFKRFAANANEAKLISDRIVVARGEIPGKAADANDEDPGSEKKRARKSTFMDVGQLRQIEGMSMDLFRRVGPLMTVFSFDGSINPLTAPEEIFAASPSARNADARARRDAFRAGRRGKSDPDKGEGAEADDFGPGYTITVEAQTADNRYSSNKTYVIAIGLDQALPYRILSIRPSVATVR